MKASPLRHQRHSLPHSDAQYGGVVAGHHQVEIFLPRSPSRDLAALRDSKRCIGGYEEKTN
jgi:hypothetical protein